MSNNLAVSGVSLSLMQCEGGMLQPKIQMLSVSKSMWSKRQCEKQGRMCMISWQFLFHAVMHADKHNTVKCYCQ